MKHDDEALYALVTALNARVAELQADVSYVRRVLEGLSRLPGIVGKTLQTILKE